MQMIDVFLLMFTTTKLPRKLYFLRCTIFLRDSAQHALGPYCFYSRPGRHWSGCITRHTAASTHTCAGQSERIGALKVKVGPRMVVVYTGQMYAPVVSFSSAVTPRTRMTGIASCSTLGTESLMTPRALSQRAPSMRRPCT